MVLIVYRALPSAPQSYPEILHPQTMLGIHRDPPQEFPQGGNWRELEGRVLVLLDDGALLTDVDAVEELTDILLLHLRRLLDERRGA